jgi:hypothetical protein
MNENQIIKNNNDTKSLPKTGDVLNPILEEIVKDSSCMEKNSSYLRFIRKEFGIIPLEKSVTDLYSKCDKEKNFDGILRLLSLTGIKPSEEIIQNEYKCILDSVLFSINPEPINWFTESDLNHSINRFIDYVKDIQKETGINPSKELVKRAYHRVIELGGIKRVEDLHNVIGSFGRFKEEFVQKIFIDYIKLGGFENLKLLEEYTGYKLSQESFTKGCIDHVLEEDCKYLTLVKVNDERISSVKYLKQQSKYEFPNEILSHTFKNLLNSKEKEFTIALQDKMADYLSEPGTNGLVKLKGLCDLFDINPSEDLIQNYYSDIIQSVNYENKDKIESYLSFTLEMTGIKPSKKMIEKAYFRLIKENCENLEYITQYFEVPSEEFIHRAYELVINEGHPYGKLIDLHRSFKCKAPEELIQTAFREHIKDGDLSSLAYLRSRRYRPEFKNSEVQQGYLKLIKAGDLKKVHKLYELSNIELSESNRIYFLEALGTTM